MKFSNINFYQKPQIPQELNLNYFILISLFISLFLPLLLSLPLPKISIFVIPCSSPHPKRVPNQTYADVMWFACLQIDLCSNLSSSLLFSGKCHHQHHHFTVSTNKPLLYCMQLCMKNILCACDNFQEKP